MVGYLSAALDGDFGGAGQGAAPRSREGAAAVAESSPERRDRAERLRRVQQAVAARTPTQRDADRRLFLSRLEDPGARADFERFGWMSPMNAQAVFRFWEELDPSIFDGLEADSV